MRRWIDRHFALVVVLAIVSIAYLVTAILGVLGAFE